jgi:hypothetical protein
MTAFQSYTCHVYHWNVLLLRIRRSQLQISARRPANLIEAFVVILSTSRQTLVSYLKVGHTRFFLHPSQFAIHISPLHSTLYNLSH